jgi:hypothetical protein
LGGANQSSSGDGQARTMCKKGADFLHLLRVFDYQLGVLTHYQQYAIWEWVLPYAIAMLWGLPRDKEPKFSAEKNITTGDLFSFSR